MADGSPPPTATDAPNPEVTAKATRRRFTASYKLKVLEEADALEGTGKVGELLRRESLYRAQLRLWRAEREQGQLDALRPKKRGRKPNPDKVLGEENQRLQRENARLARELAQAKKIIEIQKKVAAMLEELETTPESNGSDS